MSSALSKTKTIRPSWLHTKSNFLKLVYPQPSWRAHYVLCTSSATQPSNMLIQYNCSPVSTTSSLKARRELLNWLYLSFISSPGRFLHQNLLVRENAIAIKGIFNAVLLPGSHTLSFTCSQAVNAEDLRVTHTQTLKLPKCWGYVWECCALTAFLASGKTGGMNNCKQNYYSMRALQSYALTNTIIAEQRKREEKRKLRMRDTLCGRLTLNKECAPRDAMTDSRWRNREPTPFHQLRAHSYGTRGNRGKWITHNR